MIEQRTADIVFPGLDILGPPAAAPAYADRLRPLAKPPDTVVFVRNSSPLVGQPIQSTDDRALDVVAPE